jgi:dipeptidyl aminopeptidase/acylaminoacyl peptidase
MKRLALLLTLTLFVMTPIAAQKRAFGIEDLYRIKGVGELDVSPDGKQVAYTVTVSDFPKGKRTSSIWISDSDGKNARAITQGEHDSTPHFSPDGKSISFLRVKDDLTNLFLLPISGGGEASQLTTISTGITDPVWSSDGKRILFSSDVLPECKGDDACDKEASDRWNEGKLQAHMTDELLARHWTSWRDGRITHTFSVELDKKTVRDLTPGKLDFPPFQLGGPPQYDISPDGSEVVLTSNPDRDRASSTNNDLYLLSMSGDATPRNITAANKAFDGSPKYSPDGRYIAYRMQRQPGYESDRFLLALYDRKTNTSRPLTESFDNWIDDFDWSSDSKAIYFAAGVEGRNPIYRVDLASGAIGKVFEDRTIDDFEFSGDGKTIYYIGRSVGEPAEIYRVNLATKAVPKRERITHLNDELAAQVDIRPAESMWVEGADGAKIQVFIVKPHDFDPSRKYPLILNVHGGPQQQWTDGFRGDWQVYPGAGYVVAFPNPHGSTGFGQAFTASISGDWGGKPFEDVMKITDALEKLPYVDRNRIGAMGWSYGGYMMNWLEGHTDRYKAIASMMGLFDLRSMYGETEELWFPEWDLKGQPWNSPLYETMSPSNYVKNFRTPCLVISGERDYRVPYTQSLQMFTALQKMNVPSRLIIYKEAGHWPSWYEMALYYTAHLEWFHKYLGGGDAPWSTESFLRNAVFDKATGKRIDLKEHAMEEPKAPENRQGKP